MQRVGRKSESAFRQMLPNRNPGKITRAHADPSAFTQPVGRIEMRRMALPWPER
jgi:hypothetical protein